MSTTLIDPQSLRPRVRLASDARPPALTWARPAQSAAQDQPALTFQPEAADRDAPPRPTGHRVCVVPALPENAPPASLPDPRSWSASLALALAETLQGRRPVGQLSRWVDEPVLATVTVSLRRRRTATGGASVAPARLRSVHLQFPRSTTVEASAHVQLAAHSTALAFRLEAWCDRWLCTALELGPRDQQL